MGKKFGNKSKQKAVKSVKKVENKKLNKLVKRGKVKPKTISPYLKSQQEKLKKSKFVPLDPQQYEPQEVEVEDVLDMLPKGDQKKLKNYEPKRKRNEFDSSDEDDDLEEYEKRPRLGFKIDNKPDINDDEEISTMNGDISFEENENEVLSDEDDGGDENVAEPDVPEESFIESLANRQIKINEMKERVGNLATSVISAPDKNMKRLKELIVLLDMKENSNSFKLAFITIQKLAAFSALEVFKDIIPSYRVIESAKHVDEKKRLKKETKLLWDFERTLVQLYKLYIRRLDRMVNCVKKSASDKSTFYAQIIDSREAKEKISFIGLKCLCELLLTHPHFNCRNDIIQIIVNASLSKITQNSDLACETLSKLYKEDKSGDVSLDAVKMTAKAIKSSGFNVNPKLISSFLSLKIKEIKKKEEGKKDMKIIRGKLQKMSRKEKKRNKEMQKLESQLLETEAEESEQKKLDRHTEIITQIFASYFRILKFNFNNAENDAIKERFKVVLTPVLEGLSKFAHLINIEFFDNVISLLHNFIKEDILNCHQSLHCLKTVFTILSGEGSALNIDPQRFYAHLYEQLKYIEYKSDDETLYTLFECIESMIVKRRKEVSLKRALAFVKRLTTVALNCEGTTVSSLFSQIETVMQNYKQSDILLDTEKCGSGVYLQDASDPEFSNANASTLWELHLFRRHYQDSLRQKSLFLLNGCKSDQRKQVSAKSSMDLFQKSRLFHESLLAI
ncbi:nucleolar complex protein 3-like protein [Leptotrombidium deliense]|uniref:NOC3-like protein n=1 Tax=Leptotrombidium deliense TaxID=299467 RepID=A0A443SUJ6_9ACAR|nr:nucleolar complex protein 3-like protein [Leptotrombidium deliense]